MKILKIAMLCLISTLSLVACQTTPTLSLTPGNATLTAGTGSANFAVILVNGKGPITWAISPNIGSLSATTGSSTTYTPPASVTSTTTVTLTASSSGAASVTAIITVKSIPVWSSSDLTLAGGGIKSANKFPQAYIRSDKTPAIVYIGLDGHMHELSQKSGKWSDTDLTEASGATVFPTSLKPMGYVRSDGISTVIYTASDEHIHELSLSSNKWSDSDLTVISKGPKISTPQVSSEYGFVRSDQVSSVVYVADTGHIHAIELQPAGWTDFDLTQASGIESLGHLTSTAFVRSDGKSSILYVATNAQSDIWELRLDNNKWENIDLTTLTGAATLDSIFFAFSSAFVRSDKVTSLPYVNQSHIHELSFSQGGNWTHGDLTQAAGSATIAKNAPVGFNRVDGIPSVVYQANGHLFELRLEAGKWIETDLTKLVGAANAYKDAIPTAFVIPDKSSSILYRGSDLHIHEITLSYK
jgi:hypothetical protein